jgi:hypothetical protein
LFVVKYVFKTSLQAASECLQAAGWKAGLKKPLSEVAKAFAWSSMGRPSDDDLKITAYGIAKKEKNTFSYGVMAGCLIMSGKGADGVPNNDRPVMVGPVVDSWPVAMVGTFGAVLKVLVAPNKTIMVSSRSQHVCVVCGYA